MAENGVIKEREGPVGVSTLELFFDLVFVFTITQLTQVLVHAPTWTGLAQVILMLGTIWWMYGGYAWLTNAVPLDRLIRRLMLIAAMAAYLTLALAIPSAFHGDGLAFGLAYCAVVAVHAALFTQTGSVGVTQALVRLAPMNTLSALLVLAGGALGGTAQYVIWTIAVLLLWVAPRLANRTEGFHIAPAHFVERHGLIVIVALGESVVAVGIGAAGHPIDVPLILVAVLGLLLNAALWWTYFGGDDERAERALSAAVPSERGRMGLDAFGVWHLPILLGIILVAGGLEPAVGDAYHDVGSGPALMLGAGVAVFLLGDIGFRRTLRIGGHRERLLAAVLALATVPIGTWTAPVAQLAVLVAVMAAMIAFEERGAGTR